MYIYVWRNMYIWKRITYTHMYSKYVYEYMCVCAPYMAHHTWHTIHDTPHTPIHHTWHTIHDTPYICAHVRIEQHHTSVRMCAWGVLDRMGVLEQIMTHTPTSHDALRVYMCVWFIHVYIYIYISMYLCIRMRICIYVCVVYTCIYKYIYNTLQHTATHCNTLYVYMCV